jgi:hypothetical protein
MADIHDHKESVQHTEEQLETARGDALDEANKLGIDVSEVVANRVAEDDLHAVSAACMSLKSPAGWRIAGIIFVMGISEFSFWLRARWWERPAAQPRRDPVEVDYVTGSLQTLVA